jgi:subtilisin family serine protease
MKKTFAVLATVAAVGATSLAVPAPAQARGIGPGLAFGLAAGALTAGAIAASHPYYYGPGYAYYDRPAYYYGPGPYAFYGGPYYRHHDWRHHW